MSIVLCYKRCRVYFHKTIHVYFTAESVYLAVRLFVLCITICSLSLHFREPPPQRNCPAAETRSLMVRIFIFIISVINKPNGSCKVYQNYLLLRAVHRVPQQFARPVHMSYRCGWHIFWPGLLYFIFSKL